MLRGSHFREARPKTFFWSLIAFVLMAMALFDGRAFVATQEATLTPANTENNKREWHESQRLNGTALGGPETGGLETFGCTDGTCDDLLLDIQVPPDPDPMKKVYVDVKLTPGSGQTMALLIYMPGETNLVSGYDQYTGSTPQNQARLVEPPPGKWRIRVLCLACTDGTYTAQAWAGTVPVVSSPLPPQGPLSFTNVRLPGAGGGEPGIMVDKDNRIFINTPFAPSSPAIFRSTDAGQTFTRTSHFDRVPIRNVYFDTDLAVAPDDGTVYAAAIHAAQSINVYTSRDHGQTYVGPAIAEVFADRPWLVPAVNGRVYLSTRIQPAPGGALPAGLRLSRSTDYGATFVPVSNISVSGLAVASDQCISKARRPIVIPDAPNNPLTDTIYVFFASATAQECSGEEHLWLAKSENGGLTWTHHQVKNAAGVIGGGKVDYFLGDRDAAGNLYVAWLGVAADGTSRIKMMTSSDDGFSWRGPFQVDQLPDPHSNVHLWLAAGEAGRVDIVWYTSPTATKLAADATWTVALARTTNGDRATPQFFQSRISPDVVRLGAFQGAAPNDPFADFLAVDLGPDGLANVIYNHNTFSDHTHTLDPPLLIYARETKLDMQLTEIVASNNQARQGEKITITATVANTGTANAAASKTEFLLDNTTLLGLVDTPAIAAGGTATVSVLWDTRAVSGQHTIRVTADKTQLVSESNEANNAATLTITVTGNKGSNGSFGQANAHGSGPAAWSASIAFKKMKSSSNTQIAKGGRPCKLARHLAITVCRYHQSKVRPA